MHDATLDIASGEFFTLLGPSGCGKTTLLRIVSGFVEPTAGTVFVGGDDITYRPPERRDVGMVFQNYALFPHMTVAENVVYGLRVRRKGREAIARSLEHYLGLVRLVGYEDRKVSELSGGQQQRVALARALAIEPRVLLLDEPLSNLDAKLRDEMRGELKRIQQGLGVTTIYVTHDQHEALTMSDRIAIFDEGICQQVGSPRDVYDRPVNAFVAKFIGDTNIFGVHSAESSVVSVGEGALAFIVEPPLGPSHSAAEGPGVEAKRFLSVRPEDVRVERNALGLANERLAIIRYLEFSGSRSIIDMDVDGLRLRAAKPHTAVSADDFRIGDKVHVSVDPRSIRIVPQEASHG